MALTEDQKSQIRMYTGWQGRWAQFDGALERAFSAIQTSPSEELIVTTALAECIRIDAAIVAAERRIKADAVGPIKLNSKEIDQLRERGRTHVARIARCFGIEVRGDSFGPSLPSERSGPWGLTGGGNVQRQG